MAASRRRNALFSSLLAGFVLVVLAVLYLGLVAGRGSWAYYRFKVQQHSWVGQLWEHDAGLGYRHVPGFRGRQRIAEGLSVAIHTDSGGFRVPEVAGSQNERPLVLALGDSITFGQGCEAERSYPFLVAEALQGRVVNAGVSGWGLAQMVLRAEELIPRLKPDYVLAFHSDYLAVRAGLGFSESRLAAIPTPYFTDDGSGGLAFQRPTLEPIVFGMGLQHFWETEIGAADYLSFLVRAAIPLLVHNDAASAWMRLQWTMGMIPAPLRDPPRIGTSVFERIAQLSREEGATLVVVAWQRTPNPSLESLPGVVVSYPFRSLAERLSDDSTEEYNRAYAHWAGSPPVLVDLHPNEFAHALIAEEIVAAIRRAALPREAGTAGAKLDAESQR